MQQTFNPNLGVSAIRGYCLKYVDDAGNAPNRTATARYAWQVEQKANRVRTDTIPEGVWVVGWLDFMTGMYEQYGHVFFMKRNGSSWQIYDSEVQSGGRRPYGSVNELLAWFGAYKPKYLGWSTHCDGRQYVKENNMPEIVNSDTARILASVGLARDGFDGRANAHLGECDDDLRKYHIGQELTNQYIRDAFFTSPEAAAAFTIKNNVYAERDELRKIVANIKPGEAEKKLQLIKDALGIK